MTQYRLTDLPTSPIRGSDKLIINRLNVSHKIDASDLVYFLAQIEFPITEKCLLDTDCPDGFVCIDGECQRLACGDDDFCPVGYTCISGYCFKLCSSLEPCGDGYICVDYFDNNEPICIPYPFPCDSENGCPPGFECYDGFCLQTCSGVGTCPEGTECIPVEIITDNGLETRNYCVPYPFPCGSVGDFPNNKGCPPGFYCYGGSCYPLCTGTGQGSCDDGFECIQVDQDSNGDPITICYPTTPPEKLVNDGKLNFIDDSGDYLTIFTANQYGDTFLRFEGIDIDPGSEEGGGPGATITFNTLWQRTDVKVRESDIRPTYENVDVLPNGTNSNIGYPTSGLEWKAVYTNSLRNVSTSSDHLATGTTSQRPTTEPEGNSIGAGEVRYNTDRNTDTTRLPQSRHTADLEIYNGNDWSRVSPPAKAPLYDDNLEKRLMYARGLTIHNGYTPTSASSDVDPEIKVFANAKETSYDTTHLEAKIGRGLKFDTDGSIIQFSNVDDDLTIFHQPFHYYNRKQTSEDAPSGSFLNVTKQVVFLNGTTTLNIPLPNECNRAFIHVQHRLHLDPYASYYPDLEFDVHDPPAFPFDSKLTFNEYQTREHIITKNSIGFCRGGLQPSYTYTGRNVRNTGIGGGRGMDAPVYGNVPYTKAAPGQMAAFWTFNTAEIQFDPIDAPGKTPISISCSCVVTGTNGKIGWDRLNITVQPFEFNKTL